MIYLLLSAFWVFIGERLAKNSPQPTFVKTTCIVLALSELARGAGLVGLDKMLTAAAVLVFGAMMSLRLYYQDNHDQSA